MKNTIRSVKIFICAAFFALFGAWIFFTPAREISALKTSETTADVSQNCAACHQGNFGAEHQTVHQKTVRKASAENVRGDFQSENYINYNGAKIETTRDDANFFIAIGDEIYRVVAVVGVKYVEQYVAEKNGEFYSLPVAYNLSEKRWVNLNDADFEKKDADFSRHLQNWKTECAACHQPNGKDAANDFVETGISCAACHGDAAEHLASKNSWLAKLGFETESKIVNPRKLSSDASLMICASCHAREIGDLPKFETSVAAESLTDLISAHRQNDFGGEKYWANGSNKFSGNEYTALVRSVCYVQSKAGQSKAGQSKAGENSGGGVAGAKINCASCHAPNETNNAVSTTVESFDQSCVQCHAQFSDENSIAEHTKHPLDSETSRCASCHQPEIVYGRMRFARTHEISVPDPLLTAEKQVPNACNLCHTDKSVNWAIASSRKLWTQRFFNAEPLSDKQFDQPEAVRWLSSDDAALRALAANSIKKHSPLKWSAPFLFEAYQTEKSPLVKRFLADALELDKSNR